LVGIRFPAPVVAGSLGGYPACNAKIQWEVQGGPAPEALREKASQPTDAHTSSPNVTFGLQLGYRILKVHDKTISRFKQLPIMASLADRNERFRMTLERLVNGEREIGAKEVGLMPTLSTTLAGLGNYIASDSFKDGDQIVAINGRKIQHNWEIESIEQTLSGLPVTVTVLRRDKKVNVRIRPHLRIRMGVFFLKDGTAIAGKIAGFSNDGKTAVLNSSDKKEKG
jgi:membrane-associated protease RseP (regulator of RpoE activity)